MHGHSPESPPASFHRQAAIFLGVVARACVAPGARSLRLANQADFIRRPGADLRGKSDGVRRRAPGKRLFLESRCPPRPAESAPEAPGPGSWAHPGKRAGPGRPGAREAAAAAFLSAPPPPTPPHWSPDSEPFQGQKLYPREEKGPIEPPVLWLAPAASSPPLR